MAVDLTFPSDRFRAAGATPEELDELRNQFRRSDAIVQRQQVEFWQGKPASALRDYLDARREVGDLNGAAPVGLAANTSDGPEENPDGLNDDPDDDDDQLPARAESDALGGSDKDDEEPSGDIE